VSSTLEGKIISYVIDNPGLKGADIALNLGVAKKDVNSILYKISDEVVFHDDGFHWFSSKVKECNNSIGGKDGLFKESMLRQSEKIVAPSFCAQDEALHALSCEELSLNKIVLMSSPSDELRKIISQLLNYPFGSIKEYIECEEVVAKKKLLSIPEMRPKLARELDRLIRLVFISKEFNNFSLLESFDLIAPSVRLKNGIINGVEENLIPFSTIGELISLGGEGLNVLCKLPNVGKKSVKDFYSMLYEAQIQSKAAPYETRLADDLNTFLDKVLTEKELDILIRRIGTTDKKGETLEKVGMTYKVTRERVRQLESKAIKKLQSTANIKILEQYLDQLDDKIVNLVMKDKKIILCGQVEQAQRYLFIKLPDCKLLMMIVYDGLQGWLDANYRRVTYKEKLIGWMSYKLPKEEVQKFGVWMLRNGVQNHGWDELLLTAIYDSNWPINTHALSQEFCNLSEDEIESFIEYKFDAKIDNGIVKSMGKLSPVRRMVYILRDAKRGLHTSDMRLRHLKMFGEDQSEHAIGATLGRMEEALIVERGVYDLYENLNLTTDEIRNIADQIHGYIEEKSCYVSMKVIYKELFDGAAQYLGKITEYMVLGVAQDDSRFSIKRGGMIGLNSKEFEDSFVSLYDSVYKIMSECGPMTPSEMKEHLFKLTHRDILTVTINMIFKEKQSDNYVAIDEGTYDLMANFFKNTEEQNRIQYALEIALIDNPATGFHLMEKLGSVGFKLNIYTLYSFCSKLDNIQISNHLISLTEPSSEVRKYNEAYQYMIETFNSLDEVKQELQKDSSQTLAEVDCRLSREAAHQANEETKAQSELLDKLVEEFSF